MKRRIFFGLLMLATSACATHTVTVFAPVKDVPKGTVVVAAVTPGNVTKFQPNTKLEKVAATLQPNDLVVIEASGGEKFGALEVRRKPSYEALTLLGVVVFVGGLVGTWLAAGQCVNGFGAISSGACVTLGFLGTGASIALGGLILAYGLHGEIDVVKKRTPPSVSFVVNPVRDGGTAGLVIRF